MMLECDSPHASTSVHGGIARKKGTKDLNSSPLLRGIVSRKVTRAPVSYAFEYKARVEQRYGDVPRTLRTESAGRQTATLAHVRRKPHNAQMHRVESTIGSSLLQRVDDR